MKYLSVATFSVRGLSDKVKQFNLSKELRSYKVDVCCIQETKIKQGCNETSNDYCLICLKTNQKDYGNGYLLHGSLASYIYIYIFIYIYIYIYKVWG